MEPEIIPVNTCSCIGRGNMVLGGIAGKTVLDVSETLPVRFVVGNNSTMKVKYFDVALKAKSSWHYHNHKNYSMWSLDQHMANILEVSGSSELSRSDKKLGKVRSKQNSYLLQAQNIKRLVTLSTKPCRLMQILMMLSMSSRMVGDMKLCYNTLERDAAILESCSPCSMRFVSRLRLPIALPIRAFQCQCTSLSHLQRS